VADARRQADEIVSAAEQRAARIRAESERELAAATQRRDSINSQLTNVRQMLATLSGTAPAAFAALEPGDEAAGGAEQAAGQPAAELDAGDEVDEVAATESEETEATEAGETDQVEADETDQVEAVDATQSQKQAAGKGR
jgi:hypothetical protein